MLHFWSKEIRFFSGKEHSKSGCETGSVLRNKRELKRIVIDLFFACRKFINDSKIIGDKYSLFYI